MKIWVKQMKDNHLMKDTVIERTDAEMTRTHKIFSALEEVCKEWDLAVPLWLDSNIKDFKERSKTRFTQDSFTERISFDFLDFSVIEE